MIKIVLLAGVILAILNVLLFRFIRDENTLPRWKNGISGVDSGEPFAKIPTYPGAVLSSSHITQLRFNYMFDTTWVSGDDAELIARWYTLALTQAGWELVEPPADWSAGDLNLVFNKKWNRILSLSIMPSTEESLNSIQIEISTKHQQEDVLY